MRDILLQRAKIHQECEDLEKRAAHLELCKRDPVYFINNFCWTYNPREKRVDIPMVLYPFQEFFLNEARACIDSGEDLNIEKCRDMGVSWVMILLFQWYWLFQDGGAFLVGSQREEDVDKSKLDPATLFGKFRYNLYKLPKWMRPTQLTDMKLNIANLEKGNYFAGSASTAIFGRSRRYKAIFFDELAFWDYAEDAYDGCSQTTNCRIAVSTPYGNTNKWYKVVKDPRNVQIEYADEAALLKEKGIKA